MNTFGRSKLYDIVLGEVKGFRTREIVLNGLFNELGIKKAGSVAIGNEDTTFTYLISTNERLTKSQISHAKAFIAGIQYALRG